MSNPYSSVALSGYNASAPPDDGTRTAANQVTWAKGKTKLADPLKVFVEAMNANVLAAFAKSFGNTVVPVASNYAITVANQGAFLSVTGERTLTLPAVATAGSIFSVTVLNMGTSLVTVDGDGAELVNGAAAIYLGAGESAILSCDGAAWTAAIAHAFPSRIQSKATDYVLLVSDTGNWLEFTAKAAVTLLAAATAGPTFRLGVLNNGAAGVTLTPSGVETINGVAASLTICPGEQAMLACDGAEWYAVIARASSEKVKTADESVTSSTTLQSDDHLAGIPLAADTYYDIDGYIEAEGDVSNGKVALTFTNAPQDFHVAAISDDASNARAFSASASGASAVVVLLGAGTKTCVLIKGMVRTNATTGGTVDLQWAQNGLSATAMIFGRGSWLKFTPVRP